MQRTPQAGAASCANPWAGRAASLLAPRPHPRLLALAHSQRQGAHRPVAAGHGVREPRPQRELGHFPLSRHPRPRRRAARDFIHPLVGRFAGQAGGSLGALVACPCGRQGLPSGTRLRRPACMRGARPEGMLGARPACMSGARPACMLGARPACMRGALPTGMLGARHCTPRCSTRPLRAARAARPASHVTCCPSRPQLDWA